MELRASIVSPLLAGMLLMVLSACGGGGSGDSGMAKETAATLPTIFTSEGRPLNSCGLEPACSGNPLAPFFANVTVAPPDGAIVSRTVRVEISGNSIANAELLPARGYLPRMGVFNITGDRTRAWLDLDTMKLPNGFLRLRISAFDVPAGQRGAREIVAMAPRVWIVSNAIPEPAAFTGALVSAPEHDAAVSGITRLEVRGSGLANVELLPATGYAPRLAVFNVSADKTLAWLDFDSRSVPDGVREVRISAFNVTQGQPGAREIVVMPSRRWEFRNSIPFAASVAMAPPHGSSLSGIVRLEVRGSGIENVELLPVSGYLPRLGLFNISADRTFAWLDLDTTALPDSRLQPMRVSAFNRPAGAPGAQEIIAMPARTWFVRNHGGNSQCIAYATINQLPDQRPALLDGKPAPILFCEPSHWPNGVMPQDCECVLFGN
mgnify:CR=1 FL=1